MVASPRAALRERLLKIVGQGPVPAVEAAGGADALLKLKENDCGTLLLDPQIEDLDVEELVTTIRTRHPELNVVVLDQEKEKDALSSGPCDISGGRWIGPESPNAQAAMALVGNAPESAADPQDTQAKFNSLPGMVGTSWKMRQMYRLARLVAPRDTAVLIVGATGTGKELVAHGIHELSQCHGGPFVVVNCAAVPESLIESELFGFTRGALAGAVQSRPGCIRAAHGGTLLLDEVGELPLAVQAKLLRFIQGWEVQRMGSQDVLRVNARLIASTSTDLVKRVRENQFREDLYYRLAVFPLDLPLLRDRAEDILPLAHHFLEKFCRQTGCPQKDFTLEAAAALQENSWPGNVRELQHRIERAFVLAERNGYIHAEDVSMPPAAA